MSKDDYIKLLDYYHEPCKYSTTSSADDRCGPSVSPLRHFPQDNTQNVHSVPSDIRSSRTSQSTSIEQGAAAANASRGRERCTGLSRSAVASNPSIHWNGASSFSESGSSQSERAHHQSHQHTVGELGPIERLLNCLEDEAASHDQIYEAYSRLPQPGVRILPENTRRLLLRRLSVVETRTKKSMLRYLTLVDHMKEASIPLDQAEWNSAIAYAGRCFARVEASEVESALHIWKEMEQEAGVKSGVVTFNILFDIAVKADKYVLAEMILEEIESRRLEYNRFSYVGLIYYHGVKGDGAAIRKAYRDLVEAGQIVDTVVMNCVIVSLIRAGEFPAAEQVYERMKRIALRATGQFIPNSDWRATRDLGRALDKASRIMRNDDEGLQRLQAEQFIVPDLRTFCIFVDHHVHTTGELRRVTGLLEDMQLLKVPIHGRIYLKIFKGFAYHGGVKYTSWTRQRLELVWASLLSALEDKMDGVRMMKWTVIWVVRAFAQCCGRQKALQIWEEVRDLWSIAGEDEKGAVEHLLRNILEDDKSDKQHQ